MTAAYTDDDVTACRAALNIKGEHFPCVEKAPHDGLPHHNPHAEAIWQGDAPAIAARAVEPYQKALAELRADFARVAVIAGQHNAGARAEQVNP